MTYEEYLLFISAIMASLATVVGVIAVPFMVPSLTRRDWIGFLAAVYPYVEEARRQAADAARRFYDSERARHTGPVDIPLLDLEFPGPDGRPIRIDDPVGVLVPAWPRQEIYLAPYEPEWFEEAMDAVVDKLLKQNTSDNEVASIVSRAVKEAENGTRRTTLWAVQDDPIVHGWARVEGNENIGSCAFCAMLISRGPVYKDDPRNAGLGVRHQPRAVEIWKQADASGDDEELMKLMTRWHPNCDCKVVPVFDRADWPGIDQYQEFESLWGTVTKDYSGLDALNAFRRYLERGQRDDSNILRFPQAA